MMKLASNNRHADILQKTILWSWHILLNHKMLSFTDGKVTKPHENLLKSLDEFINCKVITITLIDTSTETRSGDHKFCIILNKDC
jgi:hypothetical protein